jgi:hypothetical protein
MKLTIKKKTHEIDNGSLICIDKDVMNGIHYLMNGILMKEMSLSIPGVIDASEENIMQDHHLYSYNMLYEFNNIFHLSGTFRYLKNIKRMMMNIFVMRLAKLDPFLKEIFKDNKGFEKANAHISDIVKHNGINGDNFTKKFVDNINKYLETIYGNDEHPRLIVKNTFEIDGIRNEEDELIVSLVIHNVFVTMFKFPINMVDVDFTKIRIGYRDLLLNTLRYDHTITFISNDRGLNKSIIDYLQ